MTLENEMNIRIIFVKYFIFIVIGSHYVSSTKIEPGISQTSIDDDSGDNGGDNMGYMVFNLYQKVT